MYQWWEGKGFFKPKGDPLKKSYVVPMPPPNVTGYLHMGHAMGTTLQVYRCFDRWSMQDYAFKQPRPVASGVSSLSKTVIQNFRVLLEYCLGRTAFQSRVVQSCMAPNRSRLAARMALINLFRSE